MGVRKMPKRVCKKRKNVSTKFKKINLPNISLDIEGYKASIKKTKTGYNIKAKRKKRGLF
jgi:hypothetical protein